MENTEKKFPVVMIVIFAPILIFYTGMLIWAITFRAGPIKNVSEISVADFYAEQMIEVKLKATEYAVLGHYSTFGYDGTLADINNAAKAMTGKKAAYQTDTFNDVLLITKITEKSSYCAVKKLADTDRYLITDMAAELSDDEKMYYFLFSYHFHIPDASAEDSLMLRLSAGTPIKTTHGYAEWKSFYAALARPEYLFDDDERSIDTGTVKIVFDSDREVTIHVNK